MCMLGYRFFSFIFVVLCSLSLFGEETKETPPQNAADVAKISEAFGHLIGKNLESIGFKFDIVQVIKGLQDASQGKNAPMSETECVQAISVIQETLFKQQSKENLKLADEFLVANALKKGVISLSEGKLQYKVEKEGTGAVVEDHFSPLVRYSGKFLDGQMFGSSKEPEVISTDEAMEGFAKGLIGMKEGEVRTIYIHPDMGLGASSGYLPPNALLTFEVEVLKADSIQTEPPESILNTHSQGETSPEIVSPLEEQPIVR